MAALTDCTDKIKEEIATDLKNHRGYLEVCHAFVAIFWIAWMMLMLIDNCPIVKCRASAIIDLNSLN